MANIIARTLKGFRDFLPEKQIAREKMIQTIKKTYETFGFSPLETPALEYSEVLTGKYGDEGEKLMYRFKDNGGRDVAMRYDLTIPLARVTAEYPELKKPFKRYQVSPVWRAENTQKGRFREFYQCDADIVGTDSLTADAEIIALVAQTLRSLKINDFVIRINNRKLLNGFYESIGFSKEKIVMALRSVDKLEKIGKDGVRNELLENGIEEDDADSIIAFTEMKVKNISDLEELKKKYESISEGADELKKIIGEASLLADIPYEIDLSIARGLDYYTGMVFETNLKSSPDFGSIFSGGRYDKLVGMFSGKDVPAVGASVGLDRLFAAIEDLSLTETKQTTAEALVVYMEENLFSDYASITSNLRKAGINTLLYFESIDMKKQLSYASTLGIPFVVIYGSREKESDIAVVKNMLTGAQETVDLSTLAEYIKKQLSN